MREEVVRRGRSVFLLEGPGALVSGPAKRRKGHPGDLFVSQCVRFAKGIRGESAVFNQFWYLEGHYTSVLTSVLTVCRCLCRWFLLVSPEAAKVFLVVFEWGICRRLRRYLCRCLCRVFFVTHNRKL